MAVAHLKRDHMFPQHFFGIGELLQILWEEKTTSTHSKSESQDGS